MPHAGVDLHPYLDEIREEVHQLCQLRFTERIKLSARLAFHQE